MMTALLFFLLIRFKWTAPPMPPPVDSYKLCIGQTPGTCTVTANANGSTTQLDVELDVTKVWYAVVGAVNAYGTSDGSNQVVVGKPFPPTALIGSPSPG